jgi:hypothetical protein
VWEWGSATSSGSSGQIRGCKISGGGTYINPIDTVASLTIAVHEQFGQARINSFPSIAIDQVTGYIYVAYVDYSSSPKDFTVKYTYSSDDGSNWSTPAVATSSITNWQFFPWLTSDPAGGIYLVYYDNSQNSDSVNVRVGKSEGAGGGFGSFRKVNSVSSAFGDYTTGPRHDYIGITSKPGYAYAAWADYRNGNADIYMATVDFPPHKPTGVAAGAGATWVAVIWDANPEDDIDKYLIWRHTQNWTLIDSTSNTYYLDYGFDPDPDGFSYAKYKIKARDNAGQLSSYSDESSTIRGYELQEKIASISDLPLEFSLSENYPNPFNPETEIRFALPENSNVKLTVYNILGQIVEVLVDSEMQAGYHALQWSGKDVSSGVYFYQLTTDKFTDTKRMILMK